MLSDLKATDSKADIMPNNSDGQGKIPQPVAWQQSLIYIDGKLPNKKLFYYATSSNDFK